jgi:hypothetical protein
MLSTTLATSWVSSLFVGATWIGAEHGVWVMAGAISGGTVEHQGDDMHALPVTLAPSRHLRAKWLPSIRTRPGRWGVLVPFWMPFLLVAIPTAYLWHLDRRRFPRGHCQRCGYDLTGNVSGVCPECGEKV